MNVATLSKVETFSTNLKKMSVNDITTLGHTIGFSPTLDNPKAAEQHSTYDVNNCDSGNGLCSGRVFANASDKQTALQVHNTTTGNDAAQYKVGRCIDTKFLPVTQQVLRLYVVY